MTAPTTRRVTADLFQVIGTALAGARVVYTLNHAMTFTVNGGGVIPAGKTEAISDQNGIALADLVPNAIGDYASQYGVEIYDAAGNKVFPSKGSARMYLQDQDALLHAILYSVPPASQSDADRAVTEARDWATYITGDVPSTPGARSARSWAQSDLRGITYGGSAKDWASGTGLIDQVFYSSRKYALDSKASADASEVSRQQSDADRIQTGLDRAQTGADRVATGADVAAANAGAAAANGSMLTAIAQASLATVMAASASSAVQQDLSGFSQPLHRAAANTYQVAATYIYETAEDSDGGAWVNRCEHLGWYQEALNGPWIPCPSANGIQSEVVARALGGTLNASLVTAANGTTTGWAFVTSGVGTVVNGRLRVSNSAVSAGAANWQVALVANKIYLVKADLLQGISTAAPYIRVSNDNGVSWSVLPINSAGSGVFVAPTTGNYLVQFGNSNNNVGYYFEVGNFTLQEVTAWAPSGAYYPSSVQYAAFMRLFKNRLPFSSDFTQVGVWGRTALANVVSKSDGYGDKLVIDATTNFHRLTIGGAALLLGSQHSVTVRARAGEKNWLALDLGGNSCYFNLTTGVLGSTSGTLTPTIVAVPAAQAGGVAGYYDCTLNVPNPVNAAFNITVANGDGVGSYLGDGVSGLYIAQAQAEMGPPTAYEAKTTSDLGIVEVFRGNKARFPRVAALVVELGNSQARFVIYDLEEKGAPMWMSYKGDPTERGGGLAFWQANASRPTCITAKNGKIVIGFAQPNSGAPFYAGYLEIDFPGGRNYQDRVAFTGFMAEGPIELRNSAVMATGARPSCLSYGGIADVLSVAQHVYPDAPLGPDNLPIPTLALCGYFGTRVRRPDGTFVTLMTGVGEQYSVSFSSRGELTISGGGTIAWRNWVFNSIPAANTNTADFTFGSGSIPFRAGNDGGANVSTSRSGGRVRAFPFTVGASSLGVSMLMYNPMTPAMSAVAHIMPTYATGWMVGDTSRCLMTETTPGSINGVELSKGTNVTDFTGWTIPAYYSLTNSAGKLRMTVTADPSAGSWPTVDTAAVARGTGYQVMIRVTALSAGASSFRSGTAGGAEAAFGNVYSAVPDLLSLPYVASANGNGTIRLGIGLARSSSPALAQIGDWVEFDLISVTQAVHDRSSKAKSLIAKGVLTKTAVGLGSQFVAYSGFGPGNFLQEVAPSTDLDYGTGAQCWRPFIQVPNQLAPGAVGGSANGYCFPLANFGVAQSIAPAMTTGQWVKGVGWTCPTDTTFTCSGAQTGATDLQMTGANTSPAAGGVRKWTLNITALSLNGGQCLVYPNNGSPFVVTAPGLYTLIGNVSNFCIIRLTAAGATCSGSLLIDELEPAPIFHRGAATGPFTTLGINAVGYLVAVMSDGTNKRVVVGALPFGNSPTTGALPAWADPALCYDTSGQLMLRMNGLPQASAVGAPLLTMSNVNALLTVGSNFGQTSFFPGSIALLRVAGNAPSTDLLQWIFSQEKNMFVAGAQVCYPDLTNGVADMDYDPMLGRFKFITPAMEFSMTGLNVTAQNAAGYGTLAKVSHRSGYKLLAHSGAVAGMGVDVVVPPLSLKEELDRKAEAARLLGLQSVPLEWVGGFTGDVTINSTQIANVAGLSIPPNSTIVGALVENASFTGGSGTLVDPTSATVLGLSVAATSTLTARIIPFRDFILPAGMEAKAVYANGVRKVEGATKDYTRLFDGFRERIRFGASPGQTAAVSMDAIRRTQ